MVLDDRITGKRDMLLHFLAALAYRTQKALRGAPAEFGSFRPIDGLRTPSELVRHMTSVLGYAQTFFIGGSYWADPRPTMADEIDRFHQTLEDLGQCIRTDLHKCELSPEQLLHGPLSDAMTHAGQLAMLRRMAGIPVAPENFIFAEIDADRLGSDQAEPAAPDKVWDQAPEDWTPPE
ncbi:MAG TPA: hypothetical protein VGJ02_03560 [Pyrinomonadaceae bacterium]